MASGSYKQEKVVCPFYKKDSGRSITCEGIVDHSSVTLSFQFQHLADQQMKVFCCEHYRNCEVYGMLIQKYEG